MAKSIKENVAGFGNLYDAMQHCANGVRWKKSVIRYLQNGLVNTGRLRKELLDGTYRIGPQVRFTVYEPKRREVIAMRFRDRQVHQSLLQNYLAAEISRHFIYDNAAGQKGRGPDFALRRIRAMLEKAHRLYGRNVYVYTYDIKNFFGSTRHEVAKTAIQKRVRDEWARQIVCNLIDSFDGDVGIGLGSDIAQYIELATLDDLDHYIKEQLHAGFYVRYMDDFAIITSGKEKAREYRAAIEQELEKIGLKLHPKKCHVVPAGRGFKWLGYIIRQTHTGKIIMTLDKQKIIHERRKLKRMVRLVKQGYLPKETPDRSLQSWEAHAKHGNNYRIICKMHRYYQNLWRDTNV